MKEKESESEDVHTIDENPLYAGQFRYKQKDNRLNPDDAWTITGLIFYFVAALVIAAIVFWCIVWLYTISQLD